MSVINQLWVQRYKEVFTYRLLNDELHLFNDTARDLFGFRPPQDKKANMVMEIVVFTYEKCRFIEKAVNFL